METESREDIAARLDKHKLLYARAELIEKCAAQIERRLQLNFDLLAEVGLWNRTNSDCTITLAEIREYCAKLARLLASARVFRL